MFLPYWVDLDGDGWLDLVVVGGYSTAAGKALMATLSVRLEGLYITKAESFTGDALIQRAALNQLTVDGCTFDPGGALAVKGDGSRLSFISSMQLTNDYGFTVPAEETAFDQRPAL